MDLIDLGFYCNNCGKVFKSHELERIKIKVGIGYKTIFECPDCSETEFQIYSKRTY